MMRLGASPRMASASVWVLFVLSALSVLSFAGEAAKVPAPPKPKQEERDLIGVLKDGQIFEKDRACRRLALIGSKEAVPAVAALLLDEKLCDLARHAIEAIPDPAADEALRAALGNMKGRQLVGVLNSIGARRDPKAVKGDDPAVSVTALRVLAQVGDASVVPLLLEAAAGQGEMAIATTAQTTLAGFPATKEVDAAILAAMDSGDAKLRRAAIELTGQRRIAAAAANLLKAADDSGPAIRAASLKALGETVTAADLPMLTSRLAKAKSPQDVAAAESAIAAACNRLPDKAACGEKILAALNGGESEGAPKAALLRLLRLTGGSDALQAIRAASKDTNTEVKDAAIRSLADWPTADAAADLAELAKSAANPTHKVLALRGYVRLIGIGDLPTDKKLAMCKEAMAMAQRDAGQVQSRRHSQAGLERPRDQDHPANRAMGVLLPHLPARRQPALGPPSPALPPGEQ